MRFLLCGDVHFQWEDFRSHTLSALTRNIPYDRIIQVGDMGIFPGTTHELYRVWGGNQTPVDFIDGNHEQHDYLGKTALKLKKNVNFHYHKRGDITFLDDGTSIGWLGGALNVNIEQPKDGGGWYRNIPSPKRVRDFINQANKLNRPLDLFITHSCPGGIGVGMQGVIGFEATIQEHIIDAGFKSYPINDCGDDFLTEVYKGLTHKPVNWVYGHFHQHRQAKVGTTLFTCIGCMDTSGGKYPTRIYIYDTDLKVVLL